MKKILTFSMIMFIFSVMNIMAATDWYVSTTGSNTTGNGSLSNPWQTIQFAVNNSFVVTGDAINVAPGTYIECVLISKSIILKGATGQMTTTIIKAPATLPPASDPLSSIIIVSGTGVNFEISGLTIQGPGPSGCGSMGRGIFIRDGANANIHNNQILDIRDDPFSGCQNGIGIQVGRNAWSTTGTATITNNLIQGYQKGGIVVDNSGSNAIISGNTITGAGTTSITAQNGIQISRGATATLSGNTVSGNSFHLIGNSSDWGACGILLYQSGAVSLTGANNLSGNDQNFYTSGVTGAISLGAEIFGASAAPVTYGYQITNLSNQNIDARNCTFEGVSPSAASLTQLFAIEDKIWHAVDDPTYTGFVKVKNLNVYVTHTETGAKIQYGINAANPGDVVNVAAGTYTEDISLTKNLTIQGESAANRPVIAGCVTKAVSLTAFNGMLMKDLIFRHTGAMIDFADPTNISGNGLVFNDVDFNFIGTTTPIGPSGYNAPLTFVNTFISGSTGLQFINSNFSISGAPTLNGLNCDVWMQATGGPILLNGVNISGSYTDGGVVSGAQFNLGSASTNVEIKNSSTSLGGNFYLSGITGLSIHDNTFSNAGMGLNNVENVVVNNNIFQNIDQTYKCGGPGPTNRVIQMEAAWGDITFKLKNISITNNTFNNINNVRAIWVTRYTSGDPTPSTFSNVQIHNNNFAGVTGVSGKVMASDYSTAVPDATLNWWGTIIGSEILAKLAGTIIYIPWTGMTPYAADVIPCTVGSHNLTNSNPGGSIQFTRVGANNINPSITVQRYDGTPNTPTSAGTPIPMYFIITATNLANYTFEATIVLDVSGIPGFNANTVVMMSPNGTTGWVASNGTYNPTAHTYTFTTNHFSTIAFVNPVLDNTLNLYVSTSTSAYSNTVYPNTTWNTPLTVGADGFDWIPANHEPDWTYKHKTGTFYIIPVGSGSNPRSFFEAHVKLGWNENIISSVNVTQGNIFPGGTYFSKIGYNSAEIDWSSDNGNYTPDGQKYIAKLDFVFDNDTSGFSAISVQDVTIYYNDGPNTWQPATVVTQDMGGKFKCYLGDFVSTGPPIDSTTGDGLINGTDLGKFSAAYWSHYNDPSTLYKSKYDIGPTLPARYYFGLPHPDGVINFEDLAVFSMGYSKSGSGTLPDNPKPIIFSLDKMEKGTDGLLRSPVRISGSINDLRAFSMKINHGSDIEYSGVEMAGQMLEGTNFLIGKSETGKVYTDGASFGTGLTKEGILGYILFTEKTAGNHTAGIESVIARNSGNLDLEVNFAGMNTGVGVPKTFSLNQNYPNPFNPVTKIEYALPNDAKVSIKIYDMLGREVSVLVNDMQKAGYYKIDWNGSSLASGAYFYKMVAGDFVAVKKMMLIK
jgi:hypothetical protein